MEANAAGGLVADETFVYQESLGTDIETQNLRPGDLLVYADGNINNKPFHADRVLEASSDPIMFDKNGEGPFQQIPLSDLLSHKSSSVKLIISVYRR